MKNHEKIRKKFGNIAAVVFAVLLGLMTPPEGLTPAAMRALGIICGAILLFIVDSIPSHIVTILMCTCFALFGVATIPQAFSAYSSGTWWLIVGVLGIGIAVNNCGLLKRLSFYAMKLFPPTYGGMIFSLLGIGTLFSPLMPSTTAKQTIVAPIAMKIGENLGLEKRSKGMAGLFNAMYIGWAVIGTAFMSASFVSYQMIAALPENIAATFHGRAGWSG
jgi:DASS family divalent anion:Na+ symporter